VLQLEHMAYLNWVGLLSVAKSKEWSKKIREDITTLHKQGTGYKKI